VRFLLALCLLGLGWSSAQSLLDDYRRARNVLAASISAFPDDQVGSLDALRRAQAAFGPLSKGLEGPLKRGLSATFTRAEAAVVNRSETDLRVQAAVLRGGFQRALYEGALEEAADGNMERARTLWVSWRETSGLPDSLTGPTGRVYKPPSSSGLPTSA
jgi:hypothetical protein